jgi:Predicted solute binding protein
MVASTPFAVPAQAAIKIQSVTSSGFTLTKSAVTGTTRTGAVLGREASLKTNKARVSTKLTGAGTLFVVARGTSCRGKAKLGVYVSGKRVKTITTSGAASFTTYKVSTVKGASSKTVTVRLLNDKTVRKQCSRDGFVTSIYLEQTVADPVVTTPAPSTDPVQTTTPTASPEPTVGQTESPAPVETSAPVETPTATPSPSETPSPSVVETPTPTATPTVTVSPAAADRSTLVAGNYLPGSTTTGLLDASLLQTVSGNVTYSDQSSTVKVIENKRFQGYVYLTGKNYHFRNCLFEGPANATTASVIARYATSSGNVFEDSTFRPRTVTNNSANIIGRGFTLNRVDVSGGVDGVNPTPVDGGTRVDVTITGTWIHGLARFSPDANQSDNQSHSDAIQWAGGAGLTLIGNRIESLLDTTIGSKFAPATYDSAGKLTGGHPFYPNPVAMSALMVNALGNKIQPSELTMKRNWIRGGFVGINMLGVPSAWPSDDGSVIEQNWFLNDQGYGTNHRMLATSGPVLTIRDNYAWDLSNPLSKATAVSPRVNVKTS